MLLLPLIAGLLALASELVLSGVVAGPEKSQEVGSRAHPIRDLISCSPEVNLPRRSSSARPYPKRCRHPRGLLQVIPWAH
jgi:hypothetical protein